MERRRVKRIKRRLPCEFLHEGNRHRGIVVDLSAGGLFLQTDTALEPGVELEVHLSAHRFPEITLRAVVARRRFTPAVLATMIRRGVGLRIVQAPPEYHDALLQLGSAPEVGSDDAGPEIEVVVQGASPEPSDPEPSDPESSDSETSDSETSDSETLDFDALEFDALEFEPLEREPVDAEPVLPAPMVPEEPRAEAPAQDREGWIFEPDLPTDALLIDDGELDDVHALLVELGASPARPHVDPAAFRGWAVPPRLLVVSASCAARLRVPNQAAEEGVVTLAVAEADSHTLRSMLRRQGFHYVVRRPVHPEALRLLVMRALYREGERRSTARLAFGYEITWRVGWGRRPGILAEISSGGCRVLCRKPPEPGTRLTLRIPREVADGRSLSLSGRVLRCERRLGAGSETRHAFAVRFEDLSTRTRERLAVILQERHVGPATLPGRVRSGRARQESAEVRRPRRLRLRLAESPRTRATAAPHRERRHLERAVMIQEVVALDPDEERVKHVLFGRDLSPVGMRVEPHPELALGERIRLAIYEASHPEALLLGATVQRDDRERGMMLRFEDVTSELRARLEGMISELPAVESQGVEEEPEKSLVVAEIVSE